MKAKQVFLERGILKTKLNEFLSKELRRAGYAGVRIVKTALGTRIIIKAARPGLVIGRRGRTARILTQKIEEMFNLENPQIEIISDGFMEFLISFISSIKEFSSLCLPAVSTIITSNFSLVNLFMPSFAMDTASLLPWEPKTGTPIFSASWESCSKAAGL